MQETIGIDVSKEVLDAYRLSDRCYARFANDRVGLKASIRWVGGNTPALIVFEATGAYHRQLETALAALRMHLGGSRDRLAQARGRA